MKIYKKEMLKEAVEAKVFARMQVSSCLQIFNIIKKLGREECLVMETIFYILILFLIEVLMIQLNILFFPGLFKTIKTSF